MHLVSCKDETLYKISGCDRIMYSMDRELTHCVHPLTLNAHGIPQISYPYLSKG